MSSLVALAVGCGSNPSSDKPAAVTLVAYDSFPTKDSPLITALDEFTASTGIKVTVVTAGDAGTMLTKATLTAGNPEGDVMWGVDSTQLSAALEGDVFTKYEPNEWNAIASDLTALVPGRQLTPVDFGDVCINYDKAWFESHDLPPPAGLDDLIDPRYKDLLVVQNPSTSSPGLAFLMATIAHSGADGWQAFWKALRANGVEVVDGWESAYYEEFSGAAGSNGQRPLVVSYGSSPPAEVIFAVPPRTDAPTAVVESTCFRQVEFAGVLRGTKHETEARKLVDFLIGARFQGELPLSQFVYPARTGVALPEEFTKFTVVPPATLSLDAATIATNRQKWQDEWTTIVLR
ncbi:MAG: thiamine ABC transporter substrate-binding protein [Actinomycetota bacterium]|nr:thiamine ABC transporter substrate-binding protein [Actinomycetota bacterium]